MAMNRSAMLVSLLTLFCRIVGFARDMLIAKYLGAGAMADSFFTSFKLSNFFRKIFGEGALFSGFVPVFSRVRHQKGKDESLRFSSNVFTIILIILFCVTVICEIFMDKIIYALAPGFEATKLQHTIYITRLTFPYFFFITACSVLWGVLNSLERFFFYAFVPSVLSIVMIFFVLFFSHAFNDLTVCLSVSVLVGGILQFVTSYFACVKNGYLLKPAKPRLDNDTKSVFSKMFNTTLASSFSQVNTIVDGLLASFIASGVSYLYYADRIFYFPLSIIGITLGIVSLPAMSNAVVNGNRILSKELQTNAFKLLLLYGLPASLAMLISAKAITITVFQYGGFTTRDTHNVSIIIAIFACGLFFALLNKVLSVIFFANSDTKTPMIFSLVGILCNVLLSVILVKKFGVFGIAFATSSSYLINCILLFFALSKRGYLLISSDLIGFTIKTIASSALICILFLLLNKVMFAFSDFGLLARLAILVSFATSSILVYFASLYAMGINAIKITFAK